MKNIIKLVVISLIMMASGSTASAQQENQAQIVNLQKEFEAMVERSLGIDKTAELLGMTRSGTLTAWYRLRTKLGEILKIIF